ncbi:MAG: metallophosphoesterase family protein [Planctomycetota bacterium]|jgi:putative phosphoesterase
MKIGILADTHGNLELMKQAAGMLREEFGAERFFHLGDNEGDSDRLAEVGLPTVAVPGIYDTCYEAKGDSCAHVERIGGFAVVLIHDLRDLGRLRGRSFDIVCHGHSHSPALAENLGRLFLNPGHLKAEMDRGCSASCAVLEIEGATAKAKILDLYGTVVNEIEFSASARVED